LPVSIRDRGPEDKVKCGDGRGRNLQEKGEFEYFDYTRSERWRGHLRAPGERCGGAHQ